MATTPGTTPTDLEFIGHIVNDKLGEQKWYQKIANTLTALIGAIVTITGGLLSVGMDLPDWAMVTVVSIASLGTALGVRSTHNGFSESQRRKLDQWKAEYIDSRHVHDENAAPAPEAEYSGRHRMRETVTDAARDLSDSVEQYLAGRRRGQ